MGFDALFPDVSAVPVSRFLIVACLGYPSTLNIEAAGSCETSANSYWYTRRCSPQDITLQMKTLYIRQKKYAFQTFLHQIHRAYTCHCIYTGPAYLPLYNIYNFISMVLPAQSRALVSHSVP
jgi:hypothetical protein